MYGHRISKWDLRRAWDPRIYLGMGIFMTREIQEHAEQVIVHSRHQQDILRLESPAAAPPTYVVPHGIPALITSTESKPAGGRTDHRDVRFGELPGKANAAAPRRFRSGAHQTARRSP